MLEIFGREFKREFLVHEPNGSDEFYHFAKIDMTNLGNYLTW